MSRFKVSFVKNFVLRVGNVIMGYLGAENEI